MHKGKIKAESRDGQTTFTFIMPLIFDSLKQPSAEIVKVAKNLLKNGASIKVIAKSTGLKEYQVKALSIEG